VCRGLPCATDGRSSPAHYVPLRSERSKSLKGKGKEPAGPVVIDENTVYLEDLIGDAPPRTPKTPRNRKEDASAPGPSPFSKSKNRWHDHDPYRLPEVQPWRSESRRRRGPPSPIRDWRPRKSSGRSSRRCARRTLTSPHRPLFRELPTEVQYEIVGDLRLKSRQTSYKRLQNMLKSRARPLDFSKEQIKNLQQRNALTQQLLITTDTIGQAHVSIPVRIASERNREYVLMKNMDGDGGWILGIRDDGSRENPIQIDQGAASPKGETEDSDMDMEEVAMFVRFPPKTGPGITNLVLPLVRGWIAAGRKDGASATAALKPLSDSSAFATLHALHAAMVADFIGDKTGATELYREAIDSAQNPPFRLVEIAGNYYERSGQPDKARGLYDEFLKRNPDSLLLQSALARLNAKKAPAPDGEVGLGRFGRGAVRRLEHPAARAAGQRVRPDLRSPGAADPARLSRWPQMLLGDVLESLKRENDAIAVYQTIAPDSPFRWSARLRVAASHDSLGQTDAAITELTQMASERPEREDALVRLGDLYRGKERWKEFRDRVRQRDQPGTERSTSATGRCCSAARSRSSARGDWKRAEADLEQALKLEPEQPYVLNYLGYTWIEHGVNFDKAKMMIERAVDLRPAGRPHCRQSRVAVLRLGDYPKAGAPSRARGSSCGRRTRRSTTIWATPTGRSGGATRRASSGAARCRSSPRPSSRPPSRPSSRTAFRLPRPRPGRTSDGPPVTDAAPAGGVTRHAAAKLNLYLRVVDRRRDGYHVLDSLVAFADVGDVVHAAPAERITPDDRRAVRGGVGAHRPAGRQFGAARGARARQPDGLGCRRAPDPDQGTCRSHRGSAGGSADAAATLEALIALWGVQPDAKQLDALALALGADVPVCRAGRPCRMQGIGEQLTRSTTSPGRRSCSSTRVRRWPPRRCSARARRRSRRRSTGMSPPRDVAALAALVRAGGKRPRGAGARAAAGGRRRAGGAARVARLPGRGDVGQRRHLLRPVRQRRGGPPPPRPSCARQPAWWTAVTRLQGAAV